MGSFNGPLQDNESGKRNVKEIRGFYVNDSLPQVKVEYMNIEGCIEKFQKLSRLKFSKYENEVHMYNYP